MPGASRGMIDHRPDERTRDDARTVGDFLETK